MLDDSVRPRLQQIMSHTSACFATSGSGSWPTAELADANHPHAGRTGATEGWETTNLLTVSTALTAAARAREETRGAHWREDFPQRDDARWRGTWTSA